MDAPAVAAENKQDVDQTVEGDYSNQPIDYDPKENVGDKTTVQPSVHLYDAYPQRLLAQRLPTFVSSTIWKMKTIRNENRMKTLATVSPPGPVHKQRGDHRKHRYRNTRTIPSTMAAPNRANLPARAAEALADVNEVPQLEQNDASSTLSA